MVPHRVYRDYFLFAVPMALAGHCDCGLPGLRKDADRHCRLFRFVLCPRHHIVPSDRKTSAPVQVGLWQDVLAFGGGTCHRIFGTLLLG
ncbi:hypothetical protein D3C80_1362040 [compost metagenome]